MAKDPNKLSEGNSFLKTAAITTPTAIGAGIGVRNFIEGLQETSGVSTVAQAMSSIQSFDIQAARRSQLKSHLDFMNRKASNLAGHADQMKTAWYQAAKAADPLSARRMFSFTERMAGMTGPELHSAISHTMRQQDSELAHRVYGKFIRNMQALAVQEELLGMTAIPDYIKTEMAIPPPQLVKEPALLRDFIARTEKALGIQEGATRVLYRSRPGMEEGFGRYDISFPAAQADIHMRIPTQRGNVLVAGRTQQTKYLAPDVMILDPETKITERLTRQQFMMREFEETILPDIQAGRLKQRQIRKAMNELEERVIHRLEVVPNVPADLQLAAMKQYEKLHGATVDVRIRQERPKFKGAWKYTSAFRDPTEDELADLLLKDKSLFPGVSPTALARGRLGTEDLSKYYLVPEAANWGKRLEQPWREYGLTKEAMQAIRTDENKRYLRYQKYDPTALKSVEEAARGRHLKAAFVDVDKYASELHKLGMGEGEILGRRSLQNVMEFETIKSAHLTDVRKDFVEALQKGGITPQAGEIIGWTEAGAPFKMKENMEILRGVNNANRSRGEYMTLFMKDRRRLQSNDKLFGMKGLIQLQEDMKFKRNIQRLTNNEIISRNADLVIDISQLKSDRGKHVTQMVSALGEILEDRGPQSYQSGILKQFYEGPESIVAGWRTAALSEGGQRYSHQELVRQAMRFAVHEAEVSPQEFGSVFGAAPSVLGEAEATSLARETFAMAPKAIGLEYPEALESMKAGIAGGVTRVVYDQPAAMTGAGAMGSIEPRFFDILKAGNLGALGVSVEKDIMQRLAYTNPETLATHQALGETLRSLEGLKSPGIGDEVWNVASQGYNRELFQQKLEQGPFWIDPGKGQRKIYVPGADVTTKFRPFEVGGREVSGRLADVYHDVAGQAARMYDDISPINAEGYREAAGNFRYEIHRHFAPAGKGMGAIARGKIIGSRFLRGVSVSAGYQSRDAFTAGISQKMFEEMQGEMLESKMYKREALEAMRVQFEAGEKIGGMVARHPFLGQFSAQAMMFQRIEAPGIAEEYLSKKAEIVLPEIPVEVDVRTSAGKLIQNQPLKIGPLVGFAGDKDADIFSAMLLAPDQEKQARQAAMHADSEFARRYTQHSARYQLLKASKATVTDELLLRENMVAEARKLGTTQRWIPTLSLEMSAARRAIVSGKVTARSADALALTEWIEQTLLSAKHMKASELRTGGLESMMTEVRSAMRMGGTRGGEQLESIVHRLAADDEVAQGLLSGNVTIEAVRAPMRTNIPSLTGELRGIDISGAVKEIMYKQDRFESSGGARLAETMAFRGSALRSGETAKMLDATVNVMRNTKGVFSAVSNAATATANFIGAAGKSAIKNHKTIGLGFAGSLAIAAVLSSPKETIGSGLKLTKIRTKMNMSKASNRMKQEDLQAPTRGVGRPEAPNMLASQRALLSGAGSSRQIKVKARMNSMTDIGQLTGQLGAMGRGNARINIRDNRQTLNHHVLANKLL